MEKSEINPKYRPLYKNGAFGIEGIEQTTGESVSVNIASGSKEFAGELAALLNDKKVSVHHAKDVIRDILLEFLER